MSITGAIKHKIKKVLYGDTDDRIAKNIAKFVETIDKKTISGTKRPSNYLGKIEILIPCYNHAPFLRETFASIEKQTLLPGGLVVTFINDASTDDSLKVMQDIQRKSKKVSVNIIDNKENLNQAGSLNRAVKESKNLLFINLNADDLLVEDCIEKTIQTYDLHKEIYLLGASSLWFTSDEKLPVHKILPISQLKFKKYGPNDALGFNNLNSINMSQSSSSFFRASWELVGGYYERNKRVCSYDDRDFQMRVCSVLPIGVYPDYPFEYYRTDSSQSRATL